MTVVLVLIGCGVGAPPPPPPIACPEDTVLVTSEDGREHHCERGGLQQGPFLRTHSDGGRAEVGSFHGGRRQGVWTALHASGATASRGEYRGGRPTGTWTWFHEDGGRAREGQFIAGHEQGVWTEWYPSGRKKSEGLYLSGTKQGEWLYLEDAEGSPVVRVDHWTDGQVIVGGSPAAEALASLGFLDGWWVSEVAPDVQGKGMIRFMPAATGIEGTESIGGWHEGRASQSLRIDVQDGDVWLRIPTAQDLEPRPEGRGLHRVTRPENVALELVESGDGRFVFQGAPELWPSRVTLERDVPRLTLTFSGDDRGAPRSESRTYRTDVDVRDVQQALKDTFERVSRQLDER